MNREKERLLHVSHHQAPAGQPGFGIGPDRHDGRGSRARATLAASPSIKYFNGFENASNTTEAKAIFEVTRVAGTKASSAASGRWYATRAPRRRRVHPQGGYSSTFPTKGYTTSVDIYLDVTKATGDLRFDWSSAVNKPDGTHKP